MRLPADVTDADMLDVLAAIDAAPVSYRSELGKDWVSWLQEVANAPAGETAWHFRSLIGDDRPYLIFAAATKHNASVQEAFSWFVSLRHEQHLEVVPDRSPLMTVGILLTPRADEFGPWDATLIATQATEALNPEDRAKAEEFWGKFGKAPARK